MGVINIRVLAGGALSGSEERHAIASPPPDPIGSGSSYQSDLERARRLTPLVREGHAESLVEAALRYVIANDAVSTVLIGIATLEQFEIAARAIEKGPLPKPALDRAAELQRGFVGETR
jgi:L-galactose dehydrogenase/L-glyceraldehyde 3-phosphate reductase